MKKTLLLLTLTTGLTTGFCSKATAGLNEKYKELQTTLFPTEKEKSVLSLKEGIKAIIESSNKKDVLNKTSTTAEKTFSTMSDVWKNLSSWVGTTISAAKENWNYYFFKNRALKYWLDFAVVQEAFERIAQEKNKSITKNEKLEESIDTYQKKNISLSLTFNGCPDFSETSMYKKFQLVVQGLVANENFISALTALKIDKNPIDFITKYCTNSNVINTFIMKTAAYEKQKLEEKKLQAEDENIEKEGLASITDESKKYTTNDKKDDKGYIQKVAGFFSSLWGKTDSTTDEIN